MYYVANESLFISYIIYISKKKKLYHIQKGNWSHSDLPAHSPDASLHHIAALRPCHTRPRRLSAQRPRQSPPCTAPSSGCRSSVTTSLPTHRHLPAPPAILKKGRDLLTTSCAYNQSFTKIGLHSTKIIACGL